MWIRCNPGLSAVSANVSCHQGYPSSCAAVVSSKDEPTRIHAHHTTHLRGRFFTRKHDGACVLIHQSPMLLTEHCHRGGSSHPPSVLPCEPVLVKSRRLPDCISCACTHTGMLATFFFFSPNRNKTNPPYTCIESSFPQRRPGLTTSTVSLQLWVSFG